MRACSYAALAVATILCIFHMSPVRASTKYRATALGITGGYGYSINNAGQIVGSIIGVGGVSYAFFWSKSSGVIKLGQGLAFDINSEGRVVGILGDQAFSWKLGEPIRYLGKGQANAINDAGMIVGRNTTNGAAPVLWRPSGEQVTLQPGLVGTCFDINNSGKVVGWGRSSFTWTEADGITLIPSPPAGQYRYAVCINDSGVIGGNETGQPNRACVWQSETEMSYLPAIGTNWTAYGIGSSGQVVGDYNRAGYQACLWESDGTIVDLAALVPTLRSRAYGINDNGVVVGSQDSGYSNTTDVVIWEPVPEPASLVALATGVASLVLRVRRPAARKCTAKSSSNAWADTNMGVLEETLKRIGDRCSARG